LDWVGERASVFNFVSARGVPSMLIQMPGEVEGLAGRFEWIVTNTGELTHQFFVMGGSINGISIEP